MDQGKVLEQLFLKKVKEVRKKKKITQAEVSKVIGVTEKTYSKIENGDSPLKAHQLFALMDYLDISINSGEHETELAILPNDYQVLARMMLEKHSDHSEELKELKESLSRIEKKLGTEPEEGSRD
jgi:transcriptional regulator with XRE-family HTH domain